MRYQRIIATRHGGSDVLKLVEEESSDLQENQVRVRILAASVGFTDILIREGLYPGIPKVPFSPGYAVVGVVDRLGEKVSTLKAGQRIAALTVTGGYSELIDLPESECIPIPDDVDAAEAVCLVLQYVTAYQLLHRVAKVEAGDCVLIHGAAGGVGTALLELGQLAELQLYGTVSQAKQEIVTRLGGTAIDYQHDDFVKRIRELVSGGVDVVFDGIGGTHLAQSYKALNSQGKLVNYGFSSALATRQNRGLKFALSFALLTLLKLFPGRQVLFYSITGLKQQHPDWFREDLTQLLHWLAEGKIRPVISDRLPLTEAAQAHDRLEHSAVSGQLVLQCHS